MKIKNKIFKKDDISNKFFKNKKKIIFTNGCFDILHIGHITLLQKAKSLGKILIVGLNSDSSVKKIKDTARPINCENDRAYVLSALECVDYIIIFEEENPNELIKLIKPCIHVKGGDYKEDDLPEKSIVESYGGKVVIIPFVEGYSTTRIIDKINKL